MTRSRVAARLTAMVVLTGVAPIVLVGAIAIEVMRRHAEASSAAGLRAVAEQIAGRIDAYLAAHEEALRLGAAAAAEAAGPDRQLDALAGEVDVLGRVVRVGPDTPPERLPGRLGPAEAARARGGAVVRSALYLASPRMPAQDLCLPDPRRVDHAVCASLDLRELWQLVQELGAEGSSYALAFDGAGRLVASGTAETRGAVLSGDLLPESAVAVEVAARGGPAPARWVGADGVEVLGGWARLPRAGWAVAVARPAADALRTARTAQWVLAGVAVAALALSLALGIAQSQRVLAELEVEERWRTAGRIAAGLTHDLGHRVTILQHVVALADTGDPRVLPRIRDALRSEVEKLRKFVVDFGDLSRDVRAGDLVPVDLAAFARSVVRTAGPHAERRGITLTAAGEVAWARADRHLLERAALNLIWNACDASAEGAEVVVRAGRAADRALLAVEDRGAGIAADRLPRLFDAFASTKRAGAHLGVGLANVKRIVTALGGTVDVVSAPGQGSTFTLSLPAIEPPVDDG